MGRIRKSLLWVPLLHQVSGPVPALPCLSFPPAVETEHPPSSSGVSLLPPAHSVLAAVPQDCHGHPCRDGKGHLISTSRGWVLVPG